MEKNNFIISYNENGHRPVDKTISFEKKLKDTAKAFISVEMSMGQMVDDVRLAVECRKPVYFTGRTGGKIPNPNEVLKKITEVEGTL